MNKEFRKWAKEHKYNLTVDSEKPEIFTNTHTQSAWEGWKAGAEVERGACLEIVAIPQMVPADMARVIKNRGEQGGD